MEKKLQKHLSNRPIWKIVNGSSEVRNIFALKVMCVVDYYLEKNEFYSHLGSRTKVAHQLLSFASYEKFKYHHYTYKSKMLRDKMLQCSKCHLVGPYLLTFTHMALSHNCHVGLQKCAFCKKVDLMQHVKDKTLQTCYDLYLRKNELTPEDFEDTDIISFFYRIMQEVARDLSAHSLRTIRFAGYGSVKKFKLPSTRSKSADLVLVMEQKVHRKGNEVKLKTLNKMLEKLMDEFHGGPANKFTEIVELPQTSRVRSSSNVVSTHTSNCKSDVSCNDLGPISIDSDDSNGVDELIKVSTGMDFSVRTTEFQISEIKSISLPEEPHSSTGNDFCGSRSRVQAQSHQSNDELLGDFVNIGFRRIKNMDLKNKLERMINQAVYSVLEEDARLV